MVKMDDEREDEAACQSSSGSHENLRQREPTVTRSFCDRCGDGGGVGLLCEEDDLPAIRAGGKMCEREKALVLGQDVFSERAELVGREMLAGLEVVWH